MIAYVIISMCAVIIFIKITQGKFMLYLILYKNTSNKFKNFMCYR